MSSATDRTQAVRSHPVRPAHGLAAVLMTAALVLGPAAIVLLATPLPASAATAELVAPASGSTASAAFTVRVRVAPDEGEVIESVDARLRGAGERTVSLQPEGEPRPDGGGDWAGTIDPLDGIALANGSYQIEVRTSPLVGEPSAYQGHQVRLAVPPPRRELSATPGAEDPTQVDLSWDSVALPDFLGYRIQRRPDDGGAWQTVHTISDPRRESTADQVSRGSYRYRLVVVRSDGESSEMFATSDPRGVRADPDDPGTFDPPRDPDPTPAPTAGDDVDPVSRPTDEVAQDDQPGTAETTTAQTPRDPPSVTVRPPSAGGQAEPAPAAPRPGAVPFDDGVFEDLLPFEDVEDTIDVTETESAFVDGGLREGGSLNIYTEDEPPKAAWVAIAGGLLLVVTAAHLRRYLAGGARRGP